MRTNIWKIHSTQSQTETQTAKMLRKWSVYTDLKIAEMNQITLSPS